MACSPPSASLAIALIGWPARCWPLVSAARATPGDGRRGRRPERPRHGLGRGLLATAGSLYFSEVAGFEPCTLCWYQRIAMYPLVVILGVAAARRERSGAVYAAALAAIGALISPYHIALEWVPALDTGACDATARARSSGSARSASSACRPWPSTAFLLILTLLRSGTRRSPDPTGVPA